MRTVTRVTALAAMAMLAAATTIADAQPRRIPKRSFTIHGPWFVPGNALGTPDANDPVRAQIVTPQAAQPNDVRTPPPFSVFVDTAKLGGIDPGIAAGRHFVLLSDNENGIAVYRRDGTLVQRGVFPLKISISRLFRQAKDDANTHLNMPANVPAEFDKGIVGYGDVRVAYDGYRGRFWVYARSRNLRPDTGTQLVQFPILRVTRRNKSMVAVSRSEDPRDGFITYWWDETYRNGSCNVAQPCGDADYSISGEGGDYPSIAIAQKTFTVTAAVNHFNPAFDVSTLAKAERWRGCETGFIHHGTFSKWCGPFYSHLMLIDANKLAAGCDSVSRGRGGVAHCPTGRSFGLFIDHDNWVTDWADNARTDFAHGMARGVRPVTMYNPHVRLSDTPPFAEAFFVTSYIDRSLVAGINFLTLYTYMNDAITVTRYPILPKAYHDWQWPMSAVYRDGMIWVAHHDCWPGQPGCLTSIRLTRINLAKGKVDIDRRFGLRSEVEDGPTARFVYQFPALAITAAGDLVVSYVRHPATDSTWQEVRYSVWYAGEDDLRSSRLLKSGSGRWTGLTTDIGGISLDPAGTSVWLAHVFSTSTVKRRLAFGQFVARPTGAVPRSTTIPARFERSVNLLTPAPVERPRPE
ncbi:MAG: hypothetical protein IT355_01530 [Gemmatimonadaceae bacterium]|nr:hypothetical protein [Gemmatimonadaceae bacterium]